MLVVSDLHKHYRSGKELTRALAGVSFTLEAGRVLGILGANGAGKTTLFKVICGIIKADRGEVSLFGSSNIKDQARCFGFLPENPEFGRNLNARDILAFSLKVCGLDASAAKIAATLEQVGLAGRDLKPLRHFSKGMIQRLGLAQALVHDPQLLVLDEPMSGLDPQGRSILSEIVRSWAERGGAVLLSTHDLDDIDLLCHEVVVLASGQKTLSDQLAGLRRRSEYLIEWIDHRGRGSLQKSSIDLIWNDLAAGRDQGLEPVRVKSDLQSLLAPYYQNEKT